MVVNKCGKLASLVLITAYKGMKGGCCRMAGAELESEPDKMIHSEMGLFVVERAH